MPEKKDPCDESLEGKTKLMLMIEGRDEDGVRVAEKGDVDEVRALLEARADPNEMSVGSGATALHLAASSLQTDIVGVLLKFGAEPWKIDHTGFSPWMVVGEESAHKRGTDGAWHAREEDEIKSPKLQKSRQDLLELLKPKPSFTLEDILSKLQEGWQTAVDPALIGGRVTGEFLVQRWRLRESLFFDSEVARERGAHNGRQPRTEWLRSFANVLFKLLKNERVEGNQDEHVEGSHKVLTRYLLQATTGPIAKDCCHIHTPWQTKDNRGEYREDLEKVVNEMLAQCTEEANRMRRTIVKLADRLAEDDPSKNNPVKQLLELPGDRITVPQNWLKSDYQDHKFWQGVQDTNDLKNDPPWAKEAGDSLEKLCGQLVRLGEFANAQECIKRREADSLAVLFARGYVLYSNLCNKPFQQRVKEAAKGVTLAEAPAHIVPAKTLERVLMKAQAKFGRDWDTDVTNIFRILDTVRLRFICQGRTLVEQVETCMTFVKEFEKFTVEDNKVVVVRQKSGFAENVPNVGGYADIKLLVFADLGSFADSYGELMPLRIVGEVQLLLPGYQELFKKYRLVYEVNRGSYY